MQNIINVFKQVGGLSSENEQILISSVNKIAFPPKVILQKQGEVSDKIYIVEKGIVRTFYYKDGKDVTYSIATQNDFAGSMSSFFMQKPSNKMVETLEESELWELEYHKLESLFEANQELSRIGRMFTNYGISVMEKRFDDMMFYTAKERYDILMQERPDLILKVPLGMIASYLGVTQETLSRIRK